MTAIGDRPATRATADELKWRLARHHRALAEAPAAECALGQKPPWRLYLLPCSIDFGWEHLETAQATLQKMVGARAREAWRDVNERERLLLDARAFGVEMAMAFLMASRMGWEGDAKLGIRTFFIPGHISFLHGFAIKQAHGGVTFVATPVPLAHLDEWAQEVHKYDPAS